MAAPLEDIDQVLEYMDKNMMKIMFRGEEQKFLPSPNFDIVTAENVVRHVVSKDDDLYLGTQDVDGFVKKIVLEGRKMFATCVFSDMSLTCVKALFEDGLTDKSFPFEEAACPALKSKRKFRNSFIPNQKLFNPAYFHMDTEHVWDNRVTKPIKHDECTTSLLGQGTFGHVYTVWIHPGQRSFSSGANEEGLFAMKVTQLDGSREVNFHRAMASIPPHHHLLRCLVSFTFSSKYHMIYEKADSDVEKFMLKNPEPRNLVGMDCTDLADQLFGLASALAAIHNHGQSGSGQSAGLLGVPGSGVQKTGYIHDIKPENLLVFVFKQNGIRKYWFRLSDFSCAKVVDMGTSVSGKNRNSWKTVSKSGTPVYRAPEATGSGKTSRPYDLWSLGCVYLELLVWFLEGYPSLARFREDRECHVIPGGREDEGFYFKPTEKESFRLREVVLQKIDSVKKQCQGPLKDIADIIPQLLEINPQHRPTAERLVHDLRHIDSGAKPPVEIGQFTQSSTVTRLMPLPVPIYESDSDSSSNLAGGPLVKVQFSTDE